MSSQSPNVLCLTDAPRNPIGLALRQSGCNVVDTSTTDQAVALCVNNDLDALVLDQFCFTEVDGWSVAKSVRLVRPQICIVLVLYATPINKRLPANVDLIVEYDNVPAAVAAIQQCIEEKMNGVFRQERSG